MPQSNDSKKRESVGRRTLLAGLGGLGAALFLACGDDGTSSSSGESDPDGGSSSGGDDDTSPDGSGNGTSSDGDGGSSTSSDGSSTPEGTLDASGFAVGSGAFLADKDYGNPFASESGTSCTKFNAATEGPCHSNTYNRRDVTDGLVGLPTRIDLQVVDASCNPVAGAIVEIWYASPAGTYSKAAQAIDDDSGYSGSANDLNVGFCTGNDSEALASNWLRAFQITDADGRAIFDGIFPGWYASRTPHIHFTVATGGQKVVTSQLVFDETLTTQVYTKHGSYSSRGDKDTSNANDNVVGKGGLSVDMALMKFAQQEDGALLVWKQIPIA